MADTPALTCLSILVCDEVYRDRRSGKMIVVGMSNVFRSTVFPCVREKMTVMFSLTNGHGRYRLALVIEEAESARPIINMEGNYNLSDPLKIADILVEINGMAFPKPGLYRVEVRCDGVPVSSRPIRLVQVKPPPGGKPLTGGAGMPPAEF